MMTKIFAAENHWLENDNNNNDKFCAPKHFNVDLRRLTGNCCFLFAFYCVLSKQIHCTTTDRDLFLLN